VEECKHAVTTGSPLIFRFGDLAVLYHYQCIACNARFIKNHLLDGAPIAPMGSSLALAWLAGYPSVERQDEAIAEGAVNGT
jgi:hypothetical protein